MFDCCIKFFYTLEANFESIHISRWVIPYYIQALLFEGIIFISVAFAGHSNEASDFVAVLLGQAIAFITGYATFKVFTEVFNRELQGETMRKGLHRLVTEHLLKHLVISWTAGLAIALVWLNAGNITLLITRDVMVAHKVDVYMTIYTAVLPVLPIISGCNQLMNATGSNSLVVITILFAANCIEVLVCYLLAYQGHIHMKAFAIAPVTAYYIAAILIFLHFTFTHLPLHVFSSFNSVWLHNWCLYVTKGFGLWITLFSEEFIFHIGLFIIWNSLSMNYTQISAYGVLLYLYEMTSLWGKAVEIGIAKRLKLLLQNRFFLEARATLISGVVYSSITSLIQSLCVLSIADNIGYVISGDVAVVELAGQLMYLMAMVVLCRCVRAAFRGQMVGWGLSGNNWCLAFISAVIGLCFATLFSHLWIQGARGYWVGLVSQYIIIIPWMLIKTTLTYRKWFQYLNNANPLPIMSPSNNLTDPALASSYDRESNMFKSLKIDSSINSNVTTPLISPGSSVVSSVEVREIPRFNRYRFEREVIMNVKWNVLKRILLVLLLFVLLTVFSVCKAINGFTTVNNTNFCCLHI